MKHVASITMAAAATVAAMSGPPTYSPPFGTWTRLNDTRPILTPDGSGFEGRGVFNPAVVRDGRRFVMLYRAQDARGISTIGFATSRDGIGFVRDPKPVLMPDAPYERGGGV